MEILEMAASNARLTEEVDNVAVYFVKSFNRIEVNEIEKQIVKDYSVLWCSRLEEVKYQYRLFELWRDLCKHTLLVLHQNEVFCIPDKYFLSRWCKDMKNRFDEYDCYVQFCDRSIKKSRYVIIL